MERIRLTDGESLTIFRERKGLTQKDFAKNYLKVSQASLSLWERGRVPLPINPDMIPRIRPTLGEKCRILRKRGQITLREAAVGIRVSHVTIVRMERGHVDPTPLWEYLKNMKRS